MLTPIISQTAEIHTGSVSFGYLSGVNHRILLGSALLLVGCAKPSQLPTHPAADSGGAPPAMTTHAPGKGPLAPILGKDVVKHVDARPEGPTASEPLPVVPSVEQRSTRPITTQVVTEQDLGAPFYPGSTELPGGLKLATPKGSTYTSIRVTGDEPSKIIPFYTAKLGQPEQANTAAKEPLAVWRRANALISVSTRIEGEKTVITISTSPTP